MTAENDTRGGPGVPDALLAAITGEPLPDEARADAAFMAEHGAAAADVALLREQLGIIGRALAEPAEPAERTEPAERAKRAERTGPAERAERTGPAERAERTGPAEREPAGTPLPAPVPVRPLRRGRRPLALALGAVGVAAAGAMVVGLGWLLAQGGGGDAGSSADAASSAGGGGRSDAKSVGPLGAPAYLACARLVAEGEVTDVRPGPGGREERITLDVTRSYKPAGSEDEVTFLIRTTAGLAEGDQVLVAIRRGAGSPDFWVIGERDILPQRQALDRALPAAEGLACE
ncbi:hypothetical protein [Streptomyces cadmiisoli]|uniref:Uncharacterized protein n=1 Tax=Streptomyces cadmiisoli TaxID=2184053 RepID=A0A2Z4J3C9_9ACTN|nr:hypothetical protein [Streptomyces cadmiisoli]AWW39554.1 hypothetical protein DN051_25225 [Streptomyces cadmiisoli]